MLKIGRNTTFINVIEELRKVDEKPNHPIIFFHNCIQKGYLKVDFDSKIIGSDFICKITSITITNDLIDVSYFDTITSKIESGCTINEIYNYIKFISLIIDDNFTSEVWEKYVKESWN